MPTALLARVGRAHVYTRTALTVLLSTGLAPAIPAAAQDQTRETVIEWNRVLNQAFATPGANPGTVFFTRPYALVNVAIFEAVNSIERRYLPYHMWVGADPNASSEAAAAQAAHDVLVAIMPSQQAMFDAALATSLGALPSPSRTAAGQLVGAAAAREILEVRRNDGWYRTSPEYVLPNVAGYWQPTPPNNPTATLTHYPDVTAFGLEGSQQFVPAAPPALTSQQYADDFNQVKALGSVNSTTRTAEQTIIARTIAGVGTTTGPNRLWNLVLARDRAGRGMVAAGYLATLPKLPRQHGLHRRRRVACADARVRAGRHPVHGQLA
jgi:hypothetical protein